MVYLCILASQVGLGQNLNHQVDHAQTRHPTPLHTQAPIAELAPAQQGRKGGLDELSRSGLGCGRRASAQL